MAEQSTPIIVFLELQYDSGVQRYCTADDTTVWDGKTWTGGAGILSISTKESRTNGDAPTWEVTFSGLPVALVSQALQEPVYNRPWSLWVNQYAMTPTGRTFVATLHADTGVMDSIEVQDDAADLLAS